jgi:hypothetical protein
MVVRGSACVFDAHTFPEVGHRREMASLVKRNGDRRSPEHQLFVAQVFRFEAPTFCRRIVASDGAHAKRAYQEGGNGPHANGREVRRDYMRGFNGGIHRFLLDRVATYGP